MEATMSWTSRAKFAMLEVEKILSKEIFGRSGYPPIITFPYSEGDNCIFAWDAFKEGRLSSEELVKRFSRAVLLYTQTKTRLKRIS